MAKDIEKKIALLEVTQAKVKLLRELLTAYQRVRDVYFAPYYRYEYDLVEYHPHTGVYGARVTEAEKGWKSYRTNNKLCKRIERKIDKLNTRVLKLALKLGMRLEE